MFSQRQPVIREQRIWRRVASPKTGYGFFSRSKIPPPSQAPSFLLNPAFLLLINPALGNLEDRTWASTLCAVRAWHGSRPWPPCWPLERPGAGAGRQQRQQQPRGPPPGAPAQRTSSCRSGVGRASPTAPPRPCSSPCRTAGGSCCWRWCTCRRRTVRRWIRCSTG